MQPQQVKTPPKEQLKTPPKPSITAPKSAKPHITSKIVAQKRAPTPKTAVTAAATAKKNTSPSSVTPKPKATQTVAAKRKTNVAAVATTAIAKRPTKTSAVPMPTAAQASVKVNKINQARKKPPTMPNAPKPKAQVRNQTTLEEIIAREKQAPNVPIAQSAIIVPWQNVLSNAKSLVEGMKKPPSVCEKETARAFALVAEYMDTVEEDRKDEEKNVTPLVDKKGNIFEKALPLWDENAKSSIDVLHAVQSINFWLIDCLSGTNKKFGSDVAHTRMLCTYIGTYDCAYAEHETFSDCANAEIWTTKTNQFFFCLTQNIN